MNEPAELELACGFCWTGDKVSGCSVAPLKRSRFAGLRWCSRCWPPFFSAPAAPNYFTRTWQVEQGLPQNKVSAVVQTRDGYLWVGTYN
jgi:hypothetical protein